MPSSTRPKSPPEGNPNGVMTSADILHNRSKSHSPPPKPESSGGRMGVSTHLDTERPSNAETSPPTKMKSIFPLYDPNVSLEKQKYYPRRSSSLPQIIIPKTSPSIPFIPSLPINRVQQQNERVSFSSIDALARLWEATNGELSQASLGIFHLQMRKVDAFTFMFGTQSTPFYTLRTNPMHDIEVHRTHPSKPNTKSPVVTLNIGDISRAGPVGVALSLFPKLAEIITREEALGVALKYQLAPHHAMEIESDALRRSEAQNSCILELRPGQTKYNVYHAALAGCDITSAAEFASQPRNEQSGLLHASVLTSLPNTIATRQYPKIQIAASSPDTNNKFLIALDLETMALSIDTKQILSAIPSFYAVDAMVAAILIIVVSNEVSRPILAGMSMQSPKLSARPDSHRTDSLTLEVPIGKAGKVFIATQAEREEIEEAALMEQIRSQPRIQAKTRFSLMSILPGRKDEPAGAKSKKKNKKKSKPVAVEDIDLEQYGEYKQHTHDKQKLPRPTRVLLKSISWGFSAIVWALTIIVKFVTYMVITMTKCLAREKV
ncbi:predicted protein [Uncinocarpus reesii 1704]|uniref:Uncharacterized protein n=1 Tax=Uncinocarpus reesii (strain UAMH 1704) TaxID=336963 RepID=C4JYM1_UNCRE|nr:uncharacterized protein UREG_07272 [Uncinocarpus reesii 1704]EEP82407.1 predicted protein [Uncinocarpus reesii 1704]